METDISVFLLHSLGASWLSRRLNSAPGLTGSRLLISQELKVQFAW